MKPLNHTDEHEMNKKRSVGLNRAGLALLRETPFVQAPRNEALSLEGVNYFV